MARRDLAMLRPSGDGAFDLWRACSLGLQGDAERILGEEGGAVDINWPHFDEDSSTALHQACRRGKPALAARLAAAGARLDAKTARGEVPLHYAVRSGKVPAVKQMLELRPDLIGAQNADGDTPLHVAVARHQMSVIVHLVEAGADFTIQNEMGDSPTDLAHRISDFEAMDYLLQQTSGRSVQHGVRQLLTMSRGSSRSSAMSTSSDATL